MSSVLLLQVDPDITALLRDSTSLPQDTQFIELEQPERLLQQLQDSGDEINALVLGARLEAPIQVVQRLHAAYRDLAVVILSSRENLPSIRRALQFAPFIGEDVSTRPSEDAQELAVTIHEAFIRTQQRRRYRATAAAISSRVATLEPQPQHVQYLDRLLDHAPVGIVTVDDQGRVSAWNRRASEIMECGEREALGTRLAALFPGAEQQALSETIKSSFDESARTPPRIFERSTSGGDRQFVEVTATALAGRGGDQGALVLFQDVTDRVIAERERSEAIRVRDELLLREQAARQEAEAAQQRFAFLAEASRALTSSIDYEERLQSLTRLAVPFLADWCVVDIVNEDHWFIRAAVTARLPEKQALLEQVREHYPPTRDSQQPAAQALRRGEAVLISGVDDELMAKTTYNQDHLHMLRDLAPRAAIAVPLVARDTTIGVITLVVSESERQYGQDDLSLAEEFARRAAIAIDNAGLYREVQEALQSRDRFLSIAAHELKTPITALVGYSQLLQRRAERKGDTDPRDKRALQALSEQAHRLHRLIVSLLDLSRIQLGQLTIERQTIDLSLVTRRVAEEIQAASEKHSYDIRIPDRKLPIEGDELRLEQVLLNLLHNAIKYSPEGGVIGLHVEPQDEHVCIGISDQGIGIPSSSLPYLFSRFYRAGNVNQQQIAGMGLGLFVVNEIVILHGGTIEVESEVGKGSTFSIYLPLASAL